jgi:hypothetical protein
MVGGVKDGLRHVAREIRGEGEESTVDNAFQPVP